MDNYKKFNQICNDFEKLAKRGNDCYFEADDNCRWMNIYLQSPTRKISKLIFQKMEEMGYHETIELRGKHSKYYEAEELPEIGIIFPKKIIISA